MLTISLLKNIAAKFSKPYESDADFQSSLEQLEEIERTLFCIQPDKKYSLNVGSVASSEDISSQVHTSPSKELSDEQPQNSLVVSFLVRQHALEILGNSDDLRTVMKKTFNREFLNMMQVCIFVPFLHAETPKPQNIPKVPSSKDSAVPHAFLISRVLNFRNSLSQQQKQPAKQRT